MKKGIKFVCAVFSAVALLSSCTVNKTVEPVRTITVNGKGSISVEPDIATIEFSLSTIGWSAKQITTDNNTLTTRLCDSLKNAGVNENDIFIGNCTISTPTAQYEAKRSIVVPVRNLELVPAVVDCKTSSVRLVSFKYEISDLASVARRVRTTAIQQALDTAGQIAGPSGSKVGQVEAISELKACEEVFSAGKINVTSEVEVTYSLQ